MWPFKKKNLALAGKDLPQDWREVLRACNFQLAKTEIQFFFDNATRKAEDQGQKAVYRVEFVQAWQVFAQRPCFDTAVAFLEEAPDYAGIIWPYFVQCCPRTTFDNEKFAESIAGMLQTQLDMAGHRSIEFADGTVKPKALGYVYGFIDAALRIIGQDMSDTSVGIPITFQVLRHLFPGREEKYLQYLTDHMGTDKAVTLGAQTGGQQLLDYNAGKLNGLAGLARYITDDA
ncbi:MAG: hypothetical protein NTY65_02755 [Planctomycetota bacterium]|nr:hypothetical protein [Planctomycetota bacterium]